MLIQKYLQYSFGMVNKLQGNLTYPIFENKARSTAIALPVDGKRAGRNSDSKPSTLDSEQAKRRG